ncbi:hypothetical protein F2P79_019422 [Pimephales promelas]|nr:hypothetical protein F2P79_019422 [Pimephales promelas]
MVSIWAYVRESHSNLIQRQERARADGNHGNEETHQLTNSKLASLTVVFSAFRCPAAPPGVQDNLHGYDLDYRQDLDAIHTQYMTKVFWDPQWKASRREMLAGQMYLYNTPTSAFTWMADYYHVL